MGPLIQQALFYGYNALQVMQFLGKKFPKLQKGFQQAQSAGHTPDQILNFLNSANVLTNRFKVKDKPKQEKTNSHFEDELESYGIKRKKRLKKVGSFLGEAASFAPSLAAMGYLGYQLYNSRKQETGIPPGAAPAQPIDAPDAIQDIPPVGSVQPEQNLPRPVSPLMQGVPGQAVSTGGPSSQASPVTPVLQALGMHKLLHSLKDNPRDFIPKAMRKLFGDRIPEAEQKLGRPLEQIIDEFYNEQAAQPQVNPSEIQSNSAPLEPMQKVVDQAPQPIVEAGPVPAERKDLTPRAPIPPTVVPPRENIKPIPPTAPVPSRNPIKPTPPRKVLLGDKVGTVQSVRNDIAKVDVEGKERHVKVDDLEEEPQDIAAIEDSHLDQLLENMLDVIPKQQRSSNLSFVTYDPETQTMDVEHLSSPEKIYRYSNVPKEIVDQIGIAVPVTSGENLAGAWQAGIADSFGAALTQLRKDKEKHPFKVIHKPYDWMQPLKKHYAKRLKEEGSSKRKSDGKQKRTKT